MSFVLWPYPKPTKHRTLSSLLTAYDSSKRAKELFAATPIKHRSRPQWTPTTCQWLHGEPKDRMFCAAVVQQGSSYCPEHYARCWVTTPKTVDKDA